MRQDLTDITLVVDRSGSMQQICDDAEGGVNAFIQDQLDQPGDALITLVQFDTEYEFLYQGEPASNVKPYELQPRGMTALSDAVGRAIVETGSRLAKLPEADRPGLVIFVVMTDGLENSSREFSRAKIREMIEHQQSVYSWQFTFLGANQDAFAEAGSMGIDRGGAANYAMHKVHSAYAATAGKVRRMRGQQRRVEAVDNCYTDEEREQMTD